VNFTREPIIETIISPKEGCKLLVRNSKGGSNEEYYVDAVEVVSFGHSFFFRCLERPKSFLVPATDYEIMEVKEARVVLKNVSHERSIKIGGGRDAPVRPVREQPPEKEFESEEEEVEEGVVEQAPDNRPDKRRDRRRRRHRRSPDQADERQERRPNEQSALPKEKETQAPLIEGEGGGAAAEAKVSATMFSALFPPPPTLISETISRYKDKEFADSAFFSKPVAGKAEEQPAPEKAEEPLKKPDEDDDVGADSAPLNRVTTASIYEETSVTSTYFSPLSGGFSNDFTFRG